jgi:hypothetical protein
MKAETFKTFDKLFTNIVWKLHKNTGKSIKEVLNCIKDKENVIRNEYETKLIMDTDYYILKFITNRSIISVKHTKNKITKRALNKISTIIEILIPMLNCDYVTAYNIVISTNTGKSIIINDFPTMYQSAPCCIEDIGREISNNPRYNGYTQYFTNDNINNSVNKVIKYNRSLVTRYKAL